MFNGMALDNEKRLCVCRFCFACQKHLPKTSLIDFSWSAALPLLLLVVVGLESLDFAFIQ